jgi:transcriptional regulator with XRE-family HTH domain
MPKSTFTSDYAVFLRTLRQARRTAGVTQQDLARRLRMTQSAVSKCERGERRLDVIELRLWCAALGVSFRQFAADLDGAVGRSAGPARRR